MINGRAVGLSYIFPFSLARSYRRNNLMTKTAQIQVLSNSLLNDAKTMKSDVFRYGVILGPNWQSRFAASQPT